MKPGLIETIKSRGYWRVNYQPLTATVRLTTMNECKAIVQKNTVKLRGWDYPHFSINNDNKGSTAPAGEYFEGWVDWQGFKEFWRMYKSGQFLHYRNLREDWLDENNLYGSWASKIKPLSVLAVFTSVIYEATEAFEFLSRLAQNGLYEEGVAVQMSLHNIQGRRLWLDDQSRAPFIYPRETQAKEFSWTQTYTKDKVVKDSKTCSKILIQQLVDYFGWNPSLDQISKEQELLFSHKI
jgi:hypothetical protein